MFKTVKELYDPLVSEDIFLLNEGNTRGNPCKLKDEDSKTAVRKNSFTKAAVNDRRSLPEDVIIRENIKVFKSKLDKHWEEFKHNAEFCMEMDTRAKLIDGNWHGLQIRINIWTCQENVEQNSKYIGQSFFPYRQIAYDT